MGLPSVLPKWGLCCRAYGPGEVKVLVSGDGGNFAEAACWRSASRSEVSYEDVLMFDVSQMVKSLTIVMKAPMPWGYFGLNDVSLLSYIPVLNYSMSNILRARVQLIPEQLGCEAGFCPPGSNENCHQVA